MRCVSGWIKQTEQLPAYAGGCDQRPESAERPVAAGQLGGTPPVKGQQLNASIIAQTRLTNTEEFGNILLKVNGTVPRFVCVMSPKLSWAAKAMT